MDENMNDNSVKLIDEETGEVMELALVDGFDYEDRSFCVLITTDTPEEETEMMIMEEIEDENGEYMLQSLDEAEEDAIYDYYDELCEESLEDEDESEE